MNYYLVLSEINRYFQGISTLDVNWIASGFTFDDYVYEQMLGDLTRNIIPEYYESNFRNEDTFGRNEIVTEATKRHFASQVIEKTCGEDDIIMNIYGERFVAQMDKSNRFNLNVILGKLFHRDAPKIYVDDMFDMFEELVKVKYNLRGLFSIYLSAIESSVNPQYLQDDLSIKLNDGIKSEFFNFVYL